MDLAVGLSQFGYIVVSENSLPRRFKQGAGQDEGIQGRAENIEGRITLPLFRVRAQPISGLLKLKAPFAQLMEAHLPRTSPITREKLALAELIQKVAEAILNSQA
ncbi:hypothetical protein SAMN04489800_2818 [Pseudomonas deceptionensis]|uniref:Uncharacterized protein n=1 Tax=Pseudomonas deceptionensis TaxID=882211 RepID=A0A0J6GEM0_PSEDM|nr:hypothetical protein TR67_01155 [Pseudomonas deceptionensis]SEE91706.1 hypothetical protein SAMN04489800_2818 [Pseudomonas deceptionensis]